MGEECFNILSLDGGGYKGLATIACLAAIENKYNIKCSDFFDMFAGTSTGSIIALALAQGNTAVEILDLYKEIGLKIFPPQNKLIKTLKQIFNSSYRNLELKKQLEVFFKNKRIKDIQQRSKYIVVPALCLSNSQPRIFKTDYNNDLNQHNEYLLSDIALASSSAPTFFPIAKIKNPKTKVFELFVDGGMFANNPALCAFVEAREKLNIEPQNIKILSISPPNFKLTVNDDNLSSGFYRFRENLVTMALAGTSHKDDFITKFVLPNNNYLRLIADTTVNTPMEMDDASEKAKNELMRAGNALAVDNFKNIQKMFNLTPNKEEIHG